MQAGLAIFHNSEQEFVSGIVEQYQCGFSYDPQNIANAVKKMLDAPELLRKMQENSLEAVQSEYNWDVVSVEYATAIKQLYESKTL